MKTYWNAAIIIVLGCVLGIFAVRTLPMEATSLPAQQGRLDLTNWDFETDGAVKLDGQWEFYWNRLIVPEVGTPMSGVFYNVPAHWTDTVGGEQLSYNGAATYRMIVKVKPSQTAYGIKISNIRMSSAVYVNGEKVGESGRPALTREDYSYENKPYNIFFPLRGDTAEIVIHAANFDFVQGGIPYSIYFGSAEGINELDNKTASLNIVVIVALWMIGVYHLLVYIMRREEKGLLYFGVYCIVAALAFSCNGDRIFMRYIDLPEVVYYKLNAVLLFGSLIMMTLFLRTMCVGLMPDWFTKYVLFGVGMYIVFVVVTPFRVYSHFNFGVGYFQMIVYLCAISMLTVSYFRGKYGGFSRRGLVLLILALCCFLVGLVGYTLYLASYTADYVVGYAGIVGFCIMISLLMSIRYSEAFRTIEKMTVKLRKADQWKDEFLVQTSHEFQTPLNGIINISQAMLDGRFGELSERQKHNLSVVADTSRRLSVLVRDILDLEKIKRNSLEIRSAPVDVRMTVSVVFDLIPFLLNGKNIALRNEIPENLPPVHADENRLKQVIFNLVGNALKFTDSGIVTVSAKHADQRVKIFVEDTGIGIPQANWESVFQYFGQSHGDLLEECEGTGLGLYISRKILQLMHGDIHVEWSEQGKGTRIAFTLPVAEESAKKAVSVADKHHSLPQNSCDMVKRERSGKGSYTVLAVDDEPSNLHVLAALFAEDDCNFLWASSGRDALNVLRTHRDTDLVLLDLMMPGMSGFEVCREIRKHYTLIELPVVMLTVHNSYRDIAAGFEAGANDYIIKPFDSREVRARANTLLQLKKSMKAALKMEVDFLQSQIKPHFLYNALNAILALCRTDSDRAEHLIMQLARYLRKSFNVVPEMFVPIKEELELVHAYVEIEKARFEERFHIHLDVDENALQYYILPLTIQPLVENAIRHGVMKTKVGGTVRLTVKAEADGVKVQVSDDGIGMPPDQLEQLLNSLSAPYPNRGVGLSNIHKRLLHIYGKGLTVASAKGKGTNVEFHIGRINRSSKLMPKEGRT